MFHGTGETTSHTPPPLGVSGYTDLVGYNREDAIGPAAVVPTLHHNLSSGKWQGSGTQSI